MKSAPGVVLVLRIYAVRLREPVENLNLGKSVGCLNTQINYL